jgi:hypothetical protein
LPEELTRRLFNLILRQDILPYLPLEVDPNIDDDIAIAILYTLLDRRKPFAEVTKPSMSKLLAVERNKMPVMFTADSIVHELLWGNVLPYLPVESSLKWSQNDRVRVLGIIVGEYGFLDDESSDEFSDDERSPFGLTDKVLHGGYSLSGNGTESPGMAELPDSDYV